MKPSKRVCQIIKSRKITKQKGSGSELFEGPFDTTIHAHMTPEQMSSHIGWMNNKKEIYDNIIQKEVDRINGDVSNLQSMKQNDDQVEASLKERSFQATQMQKQLSSSESLAATQTYTTFLGMFGRIIEWLHYVFAKVIEWIGHILDNFFLNVARLGEWSSWFPAWLMRLIDGIFNGEFVKSPWKQFWVFIFGVLMFIVVLILVYLFIMMIFYGLSYLITGSVPGTANNIITSCKNITELNLLNFNTSQIGTLYNNTVSNIKSIRPKFPEIPTYDFSLGNVFTNPFTTLGNFTNLQLSQFLNSALIASFANKFRYGFNLTSEGIQYVSGIPSASQLIDRNEIPTGRRDNITMVDSDLFDQNSLSSKLNLQDTSHVMLIPNDIIWKMPEYEYNFKDVRKVPPSILKKKK